MTVLADITGKQLQLQWCLARNSIKALDKACAANAVLKVADIGGVIDNALTVQSFAVKDSLDAKKRDPRGGIPLAATPKQARAMVKTGLRLRKAKEAALAANNTPQLVHAVYEMVALANEAYETAPRKWAPGNEVDKP